MTDEILMLDEDETLALLRAGRTGSEPPLVDVTATAISRANRLRVQRRAGQVGAAIVLAAAASLAIATAMPTLSLDRRTVVQPSDDTPTPPASAAQAAAQLQDANLRILAKALGSDFQVFPVGRTAQVEWVEPVPGEPAAGALPSGYTAQADVQTRPADEAEPCKPAKSKPSATCERRTLPNGRSVLISAIKNTPEPGTPIAVRHAYFLRPDGALIDASMFVTGTYAKPNDPVPVDEVDAWLDSYEDELAVAAADPAMQMVPDVEDVPAPPASNLEYAREALGEDWTLVDGNLEAAESSAAAVGLPSGYRGRLSVVVSSSNAPLDVVCEPAGEAPGYTCEVRTLDDNRQAAVQSVPLQHFPNNLSIASIAVTYVQPGSGQTVRVELDALDQAAPAGEPATIAEQVRAWITGFLDKLTTAATDDRMAVEDENH